MVLFHFLIDVVRELFRGSVKFWAWILLLAALFAEAGAAKPA